jgi:hypothetical protein
MYCPGRRLGGPEHLGESSAPPPSIVSAKDTPREAQGSMRELVLLPGTRRWRPCGPAQTKIRAWLA